MDESDELLRGVGVGERQDERESDNGREDERERRAS